MTSSNDGNDESFGDGSNNRDSKSRSEPSTTKDKNTNNYDNNKAYSFSGNIVIGIAIILAIAAGSTVYAMMVSESPRIHLSASTSLTKYNAQFLSGQSSTPSNSIGNNRQSSSYTQSQPGSIRQVQAQAQAQLLHVNKKFVLIQNDFGWNGTSGGPTIRVSKGDVVQITVINAGQMAHNFGIARLSEQTTNIMNNVMQLPLNERVKKISYSVMAAMPCPGCHPQFQEGQIDQFMSPDTQMVTTFRANEAGNYNYFCMVRGHIWLGMIGDLDVVDIGNSPSVSTSSSQTQQKAGMT